MRPIARFSAWMFLSFILNSCIGPVAHAVPVALKSGTVEWSAANALGTVKIKGTGGVPTGGVELVDGKASGTFECILATFDTGIALRNEHLRDKYLEVGKHPKAALTLDPAAIGTGDFDWSGKLTLKGETKPVKGKARLKGDDLWAEFVVNLDDFPAIGAPTWQGVVVDKDVTVTVKAKTGG